MNNVSRTLNVRGVRAFQAISPGWCDARVWAPRPKLGCTVLQALIAGRWPDNDSRRPHQACICRVCSETYTP